jgi:hypothetical protein
MPQGNGWDRLIEAYESRNSKNRETETRRNDDLVLLKLDEVKRKADEIYDLIWKGQHR